MSPIHTYSIWVQVKDDDLSSVAQRLSDWRVRSEETMTPEVRELIASVENGLRQWAATRERIARKKSEEKASSRAARLRMNTAILRKIEGAYQASLLVDTGLDPLHVDRIQIYTRSWIVPVLKHALLSIHGLDLGQCSREEHEAVWEDSPVGLRTTGKLRASKGLLDLLRQVMERADLIKGCAFEIETREYLAPHFEDTIAAPLREALAEIMANNNRPITTGKRA